jgi:uncharacterized membrane protein YphA (DoxX/SURF4 family)
MSLSWTQQDTMTGRSWVRAALLLALRFGMAVVFIGAAIPKIQAPDLFALNIYNYQILPAWGVNAMAVLLPWLELVIGVGLGLGIWSRACALTMTGLMSVFLVALVTAAVRGLNISCGCFEVGEQTAGSSLIWAALRDLAFLVAAVLLVRTDGGPRPLDFIRLKKSN